MLKMIFKDLRISPLRNILTSISMLVGIIAMIGSFLVGTLGKDYLISVNAQMYGWTPTYSYSITDSDFQDSIKMEEFFYKIREIDDCVTITFDMRENIRFAPIISVSSLQGAANDIYKKVIYLKAEDYQALVRIKDRIEDRIRDNRDFKDTAVQFDFNPMSGF